MQLHGDRLYALSEYYGLTVLDVSTPGKLAVLGRHPVEGEPFEMYLVESTLLVLYRGATAQTDMDGLRLREASGLLALDVEDPGDIELLEDLVLRGDIQDSRRRGELIYTAARTSSPLCEVCDVEAEVQTYRLTQGGRLEPVGSLELSLGLGSGSRPIAVYTTDQRMYLSAGQGVRVVDISEPAGGLSEGALLELEGAIGSRFHMNEHDGVLRVLSQAPGLAPPVLETFEVESPDRVRPLARLALRLPRPEELKSVRFDGSRAYAITFERTDPLFALDLSDPEAPRQVGELEIPGWVYHLEPRGDRLLGLGFDPTRGRDLLHASLFDVEDLAAPALLSRVHFGGLGGSFTEDQNRIHKALAVDEDAGLLMVPHSGYEAVERAEPGRGPCSQTRSGVQLIDYGRSELALRGLARQRRAGRRALLHQERLLAVSQDAVQAFDIADRGAPQETDHAALSQDVAAAVEVGEHLVRVAVDSDRGHGVLSVVPRGAPETFEPIGQVELPPMSDGPCGDPFRFRVIRLLAQGDHAFLLRTSGSRRFQVMAFDISDPTAPVRGDTLSLDGLLWYSSAAIPAAASWGEPLALAAGRLALFGTEQRDRATLLIVDLRDPHALSVEAELQRPEASLGHTGLFAAGEMVYTSHVQEIDDGARAVYYLERLDLSSESPQQLDPVAIPGPVIDYEPDSGRLVSLILDLELDSSLAREQCRAHPQSRGYTESGGCKLLRQRLALLDVEGDHATLIDELAVESDAAARRALPVGDLVVVRLGEERGASETVAGGEGDANSPCTRHDIISGVTRGRLRKESEFSLCGSVYGYHPYDHGVFMNMPYPTPAMALLELDDPAQPRWSIRPMSAQGCSQVSISSSAIVCAQGRYGVRRFPFPTSGL